MKILQQVGACRRRAALKVSRALLETASEIGVFAHRGGMIAGLKARGAGAIDLAGQPYKERKA